MIGGFAEPSVQCSRACVPLKVAVLYPWLVQGYAEPTGRVLQRVQKRYLAVALGRPQSAAWTEDGPIDCHPTTKCGSALMQVFGGADRGPNVPGHLCVGWALQVQVCAGR